MVKLPKRIQDLMMSNAYKNLGNPKHKEVVQKVSDYFNDEYPGDVEYDETGRMIDNYDENTDEEEMVYLWQSEADSCDKCTAMDGTIMDGPDDVSLHPNCKCRVVEMSVSEAEGYRKQEPKKYMPKYLEAGEGAVKLIKGSEGSVKENWLHMPYDDDTGKILKNYNDAVGYPTIGHGHLIRNPDEFEKYKNGISDSNAWSLFQNDTKNAVDDVRRRIKVPLNQNQFDVMVSQAFNLGDGNFRDTGIPAAVNRGATNEELQKLFMGAIKSKDEVVPGLKNRRSVEWKNYIK